MERICTDREALIEFMGKYKSHPCLWDVSNLDYRNKVKRISALQELVPFLGEKATIDHVRKKIDILRNGYLREYKKVIASLSTSTSAEDVYEPTLWYYNMMSFITPEETAIPSNDPLGDSETTSTPPREDPGRKKRATSSILQESMGSESSWEGPSRRKRASTRDQEEPVHFATKIEESPKIYFPGSESSWEGSNRKQRPSTTHQEELVNVAIKTQDIPKIHFPVQDMTFGLYLNNQLQALPNDQRIYAEKLMSDVLFFARTNQLNVSSQVVALMSSQTTGTCKTEYGRSYSDEED